MASRKRYAAYIRNISELQDFGWTEKRENGNKSVYELNGYQARPSYSFPIFYTVDKPENVTRVFSTTGKSLAQVYQEMTDYALGKDD